MGDPQANLPPPAGFGLSDDNHNVEIIAGSSVTTFIALLFVAARFWIRARIVRAVGMDDWWILAALTISLTGWCIIIPEVYYGGGRHVYYILTDPNLGPAGLIFGLKLNFATQFIYVLALACVKISIGFFLIRLAPSGIYKNIIRGMLCFVVFYTLAGSAALLSGCRPFAANFDRSIPGASCYTIKTSQALAYTNSALGITTDLIFACLPIPLLWHLQVNTRVKLSILGILSLGLFAASASIVKLYYLTGYGAFGDFLWDSTHLTIWSVTEVNVGIIAASIPALKPLFKAILGSTNGSHYPKYPSQKNGYAQHSKGHNEVLSSRKTKLRSRRVDSEGFEMQSKASASVQGGRSIEDKERNKLGVYNVSEESILPLQSNAAGDHKGIVKTMHISVRSNEVGVPRTVEDRV